MLLACIFGRIPPPLHFQVNFGVSSTFLPGSRRAVPGLGALLLLPRRWCCGFWIGRAAAGAGGWRPAAPLRAGKGAVGGCRSRRGPRDATGAPEALQTFPSSRKGHGSSVSQPLATQISLPGPLAVDRKKSWDTGGRFVWRASAPSPLPLHAAPVGCVVPGNKH